MKIGSIFIVLAALLILAACSRSEGPGEKAPKKAQTCMFAPEVGQVFHWDEQAKYVEEITKKKITETILARRGLLNIRLLKIEWDNGGVEVMNPIHYGPLYIGDLEDVVPVDMVVDKALYDQELAGSPGILAAIEREYRASEQISAIFPVMDELAKDTKPGSERAYEYIRFPETLGWRAETELVKFIDTDTPTPMIVLDRIRTFRDDSTDTYSYWFTQGDCLMVRYTDKTGTAKTPQSTLSNLVKVEP